MKKSLFKSIIIFCLVLLTAIYGMSVYAVTMPKNAHRDDKELIVFDHTADYIQALSQNQNVSDEILDSKIETASSDTSVHFGKLIQYIPTSSHYSLQLCFYIQFENDPDTQTPIKIISVDYAEVEFEEAQSTKSYHGSLYYNLESNNVLFWDLNGDIYNNGNTSYKIEPRNPESAIIQYVIDGLYEHDTYLHDSGRLRLDDSSITLIP
ncbi:MAG: hypothetical protein ACLROI_04690 [Beduini sp.]|uniref:hypothetical protein n=1 Tax=Beduini sp. TaxID=1922300 RepID=UPI0011CB5E11